MTVVDTALQQVAHPVVCVAVALRIKGEFEGQIIVGLKARVTVTQEAERRMAKLLGA